MIFRRVRRCGESPHNSRSDGGFVGRFTIVDKSNYKNDTVY